VVEGDQAMKYAGTKSVRAEKTPGVLRTSLMERAAHGVIRVEDASQRESAFESGAAPEQATRFANEHPDLTLVSDVSLSMRLAVHSEPRRSAPAIGILCPGWSQLPGLFDEHVETLPATLRLPARAKGIRGNA
jgi:hypothetical protein